jgi:cell filamentation protein
MDSTEFVDPYVDPSSGVLRNLVGAVTVRRLERAEADLVEARYVDLAKQAIEPTGDLLELRRIHRSLFQDVYAWAGEVRTVDIRKNVEGGEYFVPVSMIERAAVFTAQELREDDHLRGMRRTTFVERLAHHYDQLNYIHPFREGNGRAQRVFWDRIARDAGWRLSWIRVTGAVNDAACRIATERRDLMPLIEMFDRVVERGAEAN